MTQEEKKLLLLQDLCPRLLYGVKGTVPVTITLNSYDMDGFHDDIEKDTDVELISIDISNEEIEVDSIEEGISETVFYQQQAEPWIIEEFTPYLRSMSSMTDEERKEYESFIFTQHHEWDGHGTYTKYVEANDAERYITWLNKKMFDYRGLIPMGLALEAKEGMYTNF